jgi:hypothetical protein
VAWVIGLVWGIAVLIGIAVLGLTAFDIAGKLKRLRADTDTLVTLQERLADLQAQVRAVQRRVASR